MAEKKVGEVTHYWGKIAVAGIKLTAALSQGDPIRIKGATTDFEQTAGSIQIEHQNVETAKKGQEIGLKVKEKVRRGDTVYKVE
ncbi:MAG: translation elongation factor-like protein [Anaerolineales bacterium]|nr:translation elongation factor-like protein [Anaerolineales bacterium]